MNIIAIFIMVIIDNIYYCYYFNYVTFDKTLNALFSAAILETNILFSILPSPALRF